MTATIDIYRYEVQQGHGTFDAGVNFDFLPMFADDEPFAAINAPATARLDYTDSRGMVLRFPGFEAGVTSHHAYHMAVAGSGGLSVAS